MESLGPGYEPLHDPFFAAGYLELVLENIHHGRLTPEDGQQAAETLQEITDRQPNFWLITYKYGRRKAAIPIGARAAVITFVDDDPRTATFWVPRLDVPEMVFVTADASPLKINILPILDHGYNGEEHETL